MRRAPLHLSHAAYPCAHNSNIVSFTRPLHSCTGDCDGNSPLYCEKLCQANCHPYALRIFSGRQFHFRHSPFLRNPHTTFSTLPSPSFCTLLSTISLPQNPAHLSSIFTVHPRHYLAHHSSRLPSLTFCAPLFTFHPPSILHELAVSDNSAKEALLQLGVMDSLVRVICSDRLVLESSEASDFIPSCCALPPSLPVFGCGRVYGCLSRLRVRPQGPCFLRSSRTVIVSPNGSSVLVL